VIRSGDMKTSCQAAVARRGSSIVRFVNFIAESCTEQLNRAICPTKF
jgi:hypothetical protein